MAAAAGAAWGAEAPEAEAPVHVLRECFRANACTGGCCKGTAVWVTLNVLDDLSFFTVIRVFIADFLVNRVRLEKLVSRESHVFHNCVC